MPDPCVVAVDCGTHAVRSLIFDVSSGEHRTCAQEDLPLTLPNPGWVEIDPEMVATASATVLRAALDWAAAHGREVVALGLTNMRETAFAWQRSTGEALYPGIMWMSEQSRPKVDEWSSAGLDELIRTRTGLYNHTFFFASKIAWLLDHQPSIRRLAEGDDLAVGTLDSWLLYRLTGRQEHGTDATNASRYQLMGLESLAWNGELCSALGVPMSALPQIRPSESDFGVTSPDVCGAAIPIMGILADQQASLFGHGCEDPGDLKVTFGTSGVACLNTGTSAPLCRGLVTSVAWQDAGGLVAYEVEGSAFHSGFTVKWLTERLHVTAGWADSVGPSRHTAADRVYVLPSFTTMGAPRWPRGRGAAIIGLRLDSAAEDITRAAIEAMAFQAYDLVRAMKEADGSDGSDVAVDGGGAVNDYLCGLLADLLDRDVVRPVVGEVTSVGAAKAALRASGYPIDRYFAQDRRSATRFHPHPDRSYAQEGYARWSELIDRVLSEP